MCDGEMTPVTGGGVTITSSACCDNHSPANICIIKTFDPFLSFPAQGIQNVASFCRLTTREECFRAQERKLSLDTFSNLTRVSSEICKTKYNSPGVRVQIVCQSQVTRTRILITTQSLVYSPRSQYLKFSRFDDLFYAQFHISCIRAHLRNNYKKFSSH